MPLHDMKVFVWPTSAMLCFAGAESPVHEHATAQFALAVDGEARAHLEGEAWVHAPGLLVPQGLRHGYDATEGKHFVLWIEAESLAGRAIRERYPDDRIYTFDSERVRPLRDGVRTLFDEDVDPAHATTLRDSVLEMLAGQVTRGPGRIDRRVRQAIQVLVEHRDQDLSVGELASRVGISESHLSHMFREQIGVRVNRYRMWLRTLEAARHLGRGNSITDAAHEAGFADAAHLSRTFKRLIGQTPSATQSGTVRVYAIDEEP